MKWLWWRWCNCESAWTHDAWETCVFFPFGIGTKPRQNGEWDGTVFHSRHFPHSFISSWRASDKSTRSTVGEKEANGHKATMTNWIENWISEHVGPQHTMWLPTNAFAQLIFCKTFNSKDKCKDEQRRTSSLPPPIITYRESFPLSL